MQAKDKCIFTVSQSIFIVSAWTVAAWNLPQTCIVATITDPLVQPFEWVMAMTREITAISTPMLKKFTADTIVKYATLTTSMSFLLDFLLVNALHFGWHFLVSHWRSHWRLCTSFDRFTKVVCSFLLVVLDRYRTSCSSSRMPKLRLWNALKRHPDFKRSWWDMIQRWMQASEQLPQDWLISHILSKVATCVIRFSSIRPMFSVQHMVHEDLMHNWA